MLGIYAGADAVDDAERALLVGYGEVIGYALRSAERKESLLSTGPAAVRIEVSEPAAPLVALDRQLSTEPAVEVLTTVPQADRLRYVCRVTGADPAAVREAAGTAEPVADVTVTRSDPTVRCDLLVAPPTPKMLVVDHGWEVVKATVERGTPSMTARPPQHGDVESLVGAVRAEYPDAGVRFVRSPNVEGPAVTTDDLLGRLTDRQRRALELAFYQGYFERPREHNTTEVAEKFGVSRATFTQHVRAGQRKLLSRVLDPDHEQG